MGVKRFVYKAHLAAPAHTVFAWLEASGAFERLAPPWQPLTVLERQGGIKDGSLVLAVSKGPVSIRWSFRHDQYIPGKQFRDYQVEGPFKMWQQIHRVEPDGDAASYLIDEVEYELPDDVPAKFIASFYIESELGKLFRYRHNLIADDLEQAARFAGGKMMKVLVSGSTGMIGSALVAFLSSQGHEVISLIRPQTKGSPLSNGKSATISWDPKAGNINTEALEGFDAVVHLGGENIADSRWSEARKNELRESRAESTRLLAETLAKLKNRPEVFLVASAIGYYGDKGEAILDEESSKGAGFLSDLCQQWELATKSASQADIRVVNLRIGVVLSTKGGALAKMLLPFEMGAGGEIGDGKQYFSWVSIDDVVGAILHALKTTSLSGPVNVTAPNPVTNKEFTKALGKVLFRPTLIPIPSFGLRILFGEMADECLIAGQRVMPDKLQKSNYKFRDTNIEPTLRKILGK
jgi:uncharacterized protein